MNPAHYTVWLLRYNTLAKLVADDKDRNGAGQAAALIDAELSFIHAFAPKNKKNYQLWWVEVASCVCMRCSH